MFSDGRSARRFSLAYTSFGLVRPLLERRLHALLGSLSFSDEDQSPASTCIT
jgi:hypothetical protein